MIEKIVNSYKSFRRNAITAGLIASMSFLASCTQVATNSTSYEQKSQQAHSSSEAQNKGLPSNANYSQVREYIKKHREPVDYAKLWQKDVTVLCVGERHYIPAFTQELTQQLPEFKKMGMTHLALEHLFEEQQERVDAYMNGEELEAIEIRKIFGTEEKKYFFVPEKEYEQIKKIKKDKLNIVSKRPNKEFERVLEAAKKNKVSIVALDHLCPPKIEPDSSEWIEERNYRWAVTIKKEMMKNPEARILVYGGMLHFAYGGKLFLETGKLKSFNEFLREMNGIRSRVVEFVGGIKSDYEKPNLLEILSKEIYKRRTGINPDELTLREIIYGKIEKAAQELKISNEKFGIRIDSTQPVRPADYVVHLPQMEL